jgi:hypothetical protein
MTASRKLAAILAADVMGYSRVMGKDEMAAAQLCESPAKQLRRRSRRTAGVVQDGGRRDADPVPPIVAGALHCETGASCRDLAIYSTTRLR